MALLHLVNKSPHDRDTLASALRHALPGSALLLIEDGVYGAVENTAVSQLLASRLGQLKVYVLNEDLQARGIGSERLIAGITPVDYPGFVELVAQCHATQSWL